MSQRFFVENPIQGTSAQLETAEAHHFLHVMRGKVGAEVVLFDGTNQEFFARVTATSRSTVELEVFDSQRVDREPKTPVTLAVALPKGDRAKWLVEKLTELGVHCLIPLRTERGVAQPVDAALIRMRRAVIEASKQCGRNRLMEIAAPVDWESLVSSDEHDSVARFVAHPTAPNPENGENSTSPFARVEKLLCAVGPEGGLTDEEVAQALSHGWKTISLGTRILRIETAAITLAAWAALEQTPSH